MNCLRKRHSLSWLILWGICCQLLTPALSMAWMSHQGSNTLATLMCGGHSSTALYQQFKATAPADLQAALNREDDSARNLPNISADCCHAPGVMAGSAASQPTLNPYLSRGNFQSPFIAAAILAFRTLPPAPRGPPPSL